MPAEAGYRTSPIASACESEMKGGKLEPERPIQVQKSMV